MTAVEMHTRPLALHEMYPHPVHLQPSRSSPDCMFWTRFSRQVVAVTSKNIVLLRRAKWSTAVRLGTGFASILLLWMVAKAIDAAAQNQTHIRDDPNPQGREIGGIGACKRKGCLTFVYTPAPFDSYLPQTDEITSSDLEQSTSRREKAELERVHQVVRSVLQNNREAPLEFTTVQGFSSEHSMSLYLSTHLGQVAFSQAIARELLLPGRQVTMEVAIQPYARPRVQGSTEVQAGNFAGLFLIGASLISFILQVSEVVVEREKKLRQSLAAMGMLDSAYWASWHLLHVGLSLAQAMIIAVTGVMFRIDFFVATDFGVLFFEIFFYLLAMNGLAYAVAVILRNSSHSLLVGRFVIYLALGFGQIPAFGSITDVDTNFYLNCTAVSALNKATGLQEHPSALVAGGDYQLLFNPCSRVPPRTEWVERTVRLKRRRNLIVPVVFSFFPPLLFFKHIADISYAVTDVGPDGTKLGLFPLRMHNVSSYCQHDLERGRLCDPHFSVGASWAIFTALYLFYSLLALYLDNVLPSDAMGERKPLNYPFTRAYWGWGPAAPLHREEREEEGGGWEASEDEDVRREEEAVMGRAQAGVSPWAVEVRGLTKSFSRLRAGMSSRCREGLWEKVEAVRGPRFAMATGQLFALLGPNGAGKTTLINMLTGQVPPTAGDALVCGHSLRWTGDLSQIRKHIGVCPQFDVQWDALTCLEHLELIGAVRGLPAPSLREETMRRLEEVHLASLAHHQVGTMSGGMRRRLSVAMALLGDASVLFLDEPTAGMDPIARRQVWDAIEHAKADKAIVLTTHSMEEADILGDRIGIMSKGKLRCLGSSVHLKSRFGSGFRVRVTVPSSASAKEVADIFDRILGASPVERGHEGATTSTSAAGDDATSDARVLEFAARPEQEAQLAAALRELETHEDELLVTDVSLHMSTLDDVFLRVAREAEAESGGVVLVTLPSGEVMEATPGSEEPLLDSNGAAFRPVWGIEEGKLACTEVVPVHNEEPTAEEPADQPAAARGEGGDREPGDTQTDAPNCDASICFAEGDGNTSSGETPNTHVATHHGMTKEEQQQRVAGLSASLPQQTRAIFAKSALLQLRHRCSFACIWLWPIASVVIMLVIQLMMESEVSTREVRCTYCGPTDDEFGKQYCGGRDCFDFFWPESGEFTCEGQEGQTDCRQWAREECARIASTCGGNGNPACFWPDAPGSVGASVGDCDVAKGQEDGGKGLPPLFSPEPQFLAAESVVFTGAEGGQAATIVRKMFEDLDGDEDVVSKSASTVVQLLFTMLSLPTIGCGQVEAGAVQMNASVGAQESLCALLQHQAVTHELKTFPCCLDLTEQRHLPPTAALEEGVNSWSDEGVTLVASGHGKELVRSQLATLYNDATAAGVMRDLEGVEQTFTCVRPRYTESVRARVGHMSVVGLEEGLAILAQALELPLSFHPVSEPHRRIPDCHKAGDCETPNGRWAQACELEAYRASEKFGDEASRYIGDIAVSIPPEDLFLAPCAHNWTNASAGNEGEQGADCAGLFALMRERRTARPCLCLFKDVVRRFALWELRGLETEEFYAELEASVEESTGKVNFVQDVGEYQLPLAAFRDRAREMIRTVDEKLEQGADPDGTDAFPLPLGVPGLKLASSHKEQYVMTIPLAGEVTWTVAKVTHNAWWEEPVATRYGRCVCRLAGKICDASLDCRDERGFACVEDSCTCRLETAEGDTYPLVVADRSDDDEGEEGGEDCGDSRAARVFEDEYQVLEARSSKQGYLILTDDCLTLGGAPHVLHMLANVSGTAVRCVSVDTKRVDSISELNKILYDGHAIPDAAGKVTAGPGIVAAYDFRDTAGDTLSVTVMHNETADCWVVFSFSLCADVGLPSAMTSLNHVLQGFVAERAGAKVFDVSPLLVGIKDFPPPPVWGMTFDVTALVGPLLTTLNLLLAFPAMVLTLVQEKTSRTRIMMRMMGLRSSAYWASSYLFWLCVSTTHLSVFLLLANVCPLPSGYKISLFTKVDASIQLAVLFLFVLCNVSFAFLWSVVIRSNRSAELSASFWLLATILLSQILDLFHFFTSTGVPHHIALLFDFVPPCALFRALVEFRNFANTFSVMPEPRLTWAHVSDGPLSRLLVIFAVEAVVFLVLALYLDQVQDGGQGVGRHPLFFLGWEKRHAKDVVVGDPDDYSTPADVEREAQRARGMSGLPAHEQDAVVVDKLNKIFPGAPQPKHTVKDLTLAIKRNECFGLLGPNGAGKTTTINMLIGYAQPTSGFASVEGFDIVSEMQRIYSILGVCPQHDLLWDALTARQHLVFYGMLKNLSGYTLQRAVRDALDSVNLTHVTHAPAGTLSGGMKRRLSVAIALIGAPLVCFLDEPSTGLDPSARRLLWRCIRRAKTDRAIMLTTHNMEEAEALCDRLGVFVDGRLCCLGEASELTMRFSNVLLLTVTVGGSSSQGEDGGASLADLQKRVIDDLVGRFKHARVTYQLAGTVKVELPPTELSLAAVVESMVEAKARGVVRSWGLSSPTLEEAFIKIARAAAEGHTEWFTT